MMTQTIPNYNAAEWTQYIENSAALLKILGNPQRLQILCCLLESGRSIQELSGMTGMNPTALAVHLAKMRNNGIVDFTRFHRVVEYRIVSAEARALLEMLPVVRGMKN